MSLETTSDTRKTVRKTAWTVVGVLTAIIVLGAPIVQAATQKVNVVKPVKVTDSDGTTIESEAIGEMGLFRAPGSDGALATRNYPGGGGVLGAGDCTASTDPQAGPLSNQVIVPGSQIITGVLVTGTGNVRITAAAIGGGQVPLANVVVNQQNPNEVLALGTGLSTTQPVTFTGVDGTACNFIIFGI
ncbi:MAG TPA: hypothetical protein VIG64_06495 [Actinomycetota bacterium]|jgi:hypothetical protein